MYKPKISVALVVFNGELTLENAINSILYQSYQNIELIIIDGGSTDASVEIIKKFDDHIYYWHTKRDNGIFDAMNQALNIATGEFIFFIGSDDVFYNRTVIESFINQVKDKDAVYYGDVYLSNDKRLYDGLFTTIRLSLQCFSHQAIFYPKIVYKKYNYNIKYKYAADYDLNIRVWGEYKHFERLNLVTVLFNQNGQGSLNEDVDFLNDKLSITLNNLGIVAAFVVFMQRLKIKIFGKNIVLNLYR